MFSKELEALIQATLEDGILEDNEKAALVKRAEREGVDLNELEIYINSLLQRRQRILNEKKNAIEEKYEQEKKKAIGPVCLQKLSKIIDEITQSSSTLTMVDGEDVRVKRVSAAINMFSVPNTKEDIIEFLALSAPNAQKRGGFFWGNIIGRSIALITILAILVYIEYLMIPDEGGLLVAIGTVIWGGLIGALVVSRADKETLNWNKLAKIWRNKFHQVLIKGRSLMGDPEFQHQLDYYEILLKK